jgi:exodeoxyribonuclease VII large subunit
MIHPSLLSPPAIDPVNDAPAPDKAAAILPPATIPMHRLLSTLDKAIRDTTDGIDRDGIWITAEVKKITVRHGAWFAELVDDGPRRAGSARMAVRIGMQVIDDLMLSTGIPVTPEMIDGQSVRMRVRLRLHPRHHFSAQALAIDPVMTPSLRAAAEDRLRRELRERGLDGLQRGLPVPHDVRHIAIIHPDGSAARNDVDEVLAPFVERRLLLVDPHPVRFEGPDAAGHLRQALDDIVHKSWRPRADLVLIVRGGGSAAVMADIETLEVAEKIARLPMPVVLGIGHAPDRGILTDVAWKTCPTPTAAAIAVRDMIVERARKARDHATAIAGIARQRIGGQEALCRDAADAIRRGTFRALAGQADRLTDHEHRIGIATARLDQQVLTAAADLARLLADLRAGVSGEESAFARHLEKLSGMGRVLCGRSEILMVTAERDVAHRAAELAHAPVAHVTDRADIPVIVRGADGAAIRSAGDARDRPLTLHFHDGKVPVVPHHTAITRSVTGVPAP